MRLKDSALKLIREVRVKIGLILTSFLFLAIFGLIFISLGIGDFNNTGFWLELIIVTLITSQARIYWSDYYERKTLEEDEEIKEAKNTYNDYLESFNDFDIYTFEEFLDELNQENRDFYFKNVTRYLSRKNCKNYDKKIAKYEKKRDKIPPIKSSEILSKSDSKYLVDVKNKKNIRKYIYYIASSILTLVSFTIFGLILFEEFKWSVENFFRFITYGGYMGMSMIQSVNFIVPNTKISTLEHLSNIEKTLKKYENYLKRKGGEVKDAKNNSSEHIGNEKDVEGTKRLGDGDTKTHRTEILSSSSRS